MTALMPAVVWDTASQAFQAWVDILAYRSSQASCSRDASLGVGTGSSFPIRTSNQASRHFAVGRALVVEVDVAFAAHEDPSGSSSHPRQCSWARRDSIRDLAVRTDCWRLADSRTHLAAAYAPTPVAHKDQRMAGSTL